jgi:hypothetical protein
MICGDKKGEWRFMADRKMTLEQYSRRVSMFPDFVVWVNDMELHKKKRSLLEWQSLFAASYAAQSVTRFEVQSGLRDRVENICDELCISMRVHRRPSDSLSFVVQAIDRLCKVQDEIQKLTDEKDKYLEALSVAQATKQRKARNRGKSS